MQKNDNDQLDEIDRVRLHQILLSNIKIITFFLNKCQC